MIHLTQHHDYRNHKVDVAPEKFAKTDCENKTQNDAQSESSHKKYPFLSFEHENWGLLRVFFEHSRNLQILVVFPDDLLLSFLCVFCT